MKKILITIAGAVSPLLFVGQSATVCPGGTIALTATNSSSLSNPSYSMNPGGATSPNGVFTVSVNATTSYTLYVTGTNSNSAVVTTSTTMTVNVPQTSATFSISSPNSFSIGCSTKSVAVISVNSTTPAGISMSYSLLTPQSSTVPPAGVLSGNTTFSTTQPGVHYVVIRMQPGECTLLTPVSILANNAGPIIDSIIIPTQTLTCATPSVTYIASVTAANATVQWSMPPTWTVNSNAVSVSINTAAATQTTLGTYTLRVTGENLCKTTTLIPVYQNTFPPLANITSGGSTSLTCAQPSIVLSNNSSSGIPPGLFPTNQPVIGYLWEGPGVGPPVQVSSTYTAYIAGIYTLTAKDLNNGCLAKKTYIIAEGREYTTLGILPPFNICSNSQVSIYPSIQSPSANLSYTWEAPPQATVTGINGAILTTDTPGIYTVHVKNQDGCVTTQTYAVVYCVGIAEQADASDVTVFPNPSNGLISIKSSEVVNRIEIFDAAMRMVGTIIPEEHDPAIRLPMASGIYFVKIDEGDRVVVKKVVSFGRE
jgi:hypothetical protein